MDLVAEIDSLLPQTQCTRCGYGGCEPYAAAIASGVAAINRCPPGGPSTIAALARLLRTGELPLDPECGAEPPPLVAVVDEARCIGCAKCLPPCPVDAIVGAARHMHTVVTDLCTGCELCIAPCPVDCISLQPRPADSPPPAAVANRERFESRNARVARRARARAALIAQRKETAGTTPGAQEAAARGA